MHHVCQLFYVMISFGGFLAECLPCLHPVCRLFELQLILGSEEDCVQLVPKYHSKVKLRNWQSPNILSEIMRLLQNGGSGINLAQNSN